MSSWTEIPTLPPLSVLHIVGRVVWRSPGQGTLGYVERDIRSRRSQ